MHIFTVRALHVILIIIGVILLNLYFDYNVLDIEPEPQIFHALVGPSQHSTPFPKDISNATVLITGVAGFIGFSVAHHFLQHNLGNVVGIDNFNDYYDVALKYKRVDVLSQWDNFRVIEGDVCDAPFVRKTLEEYNVTHVLHLAAQAGVRYSLQNPLAYVRENVQCFVVLLEELRYLKGRSGGHPFPRFVYASSSSVYGGNTKVPFDETDPVDQPSSLYGATKRMNELLALVYFKVFGIASIGLRFFTVYGPWGRPDMAPYKFTEKIEKGENITVYNQGNMARDFTYIDDIVSGIIAALKYPTQSSLVLNLGNSNPENVLGLVQIIEQRLGRVAQLEFKESSVDLPMTYASIAQANKLLSYAPRIRLEEGMRRFIEWYFWYSGERALCASECADPGRCLPSPFDDTILKSVEATRQCDTVLYTVYMGLENILLHKPLHNVTDDRQKYCYIAFTTNVVMDYPSSVIWKQVALKMDPSYIWDSRRLSRVIKLTPTLFFASSVKHAIYLDAKLQLLEHPQKLVRMLTDPDPPNGKRASLLAVRHPFRSNPFDEAKEIVKAKVRRHDISYSIWTMNHQIDLYNQSQQAQNISMANLIDGALLVHDLKNEAGRAFRCAWSREYYAGADRDQISFPWVLAKYAKDAGSDLVRGQEWCKISEPSDTYVRILSDTLHWYKGSRQIAQDKGLLFAKK